MNTITQISRVCERRATLLSKVYTNVFFCLSLFGIVSFIAVNFMPFSLLNLLRYPSLFASLGISFYLEFKYGMSSRNSISSFNAFSLLMAYSAVNGILFAPLIQLVGSANLAIAGVSTFALLLASVWVSRTFEIDSKDIRFISISLFSVLGLSILNMFLGLSIIEFLICIFGLVGSFGFCAYEIYQLENSNFSGDLESSSSIIALRVFASILSMFVYILRLLYFFNSRDKN